MTLRSVKLLRERSWPGVRFPVEDDDVPPPACRLRMDQVLELAPSQDGPVVRPGPALADRVENDEATASGPALFSSARENAGVPV